MNMTIAVTSKWQLHIPQQVRELAGFDRPSMVTMTVKKGAITIKPKKSAFLSLAGSLRSAHLKNPIDIDNARDYIDYSKA